LARAASAERREDRRVEQRRGGAQGEGRGGHGGDRGRVRGRGLRPRRALSEHRGRSRQHDALPGHRAQDVPAERERQNLVAGVGERDGRTRRAVPSARAACETSRQHDPHRVAPVAAQEVGLRLLRRRRRSCRRSEAEAGAHRDRAAVEPVSCARRVPEGGAMSPESGIETVRRDYHALPVQSVGGEITVPGDKSISHRALMLGAIADGETVVRGFLESEDCVATRRAFEALGVRVRDEEQGTLRVSGVGLDGLKPPPDVLDLGNSGTAIRLMTGLLAAQRFDSTLTGDESLRKRPMERVATPLRAMGARIATRDGRAPIEITGGARLKGIDYAMPVASAQVKSALLLAGLYASGTTTVRSPGPSRDHTERMLRSMGVPLDITDDGLTVSVSGPQRLKGIEIDVPGDLSSAAFFIVAGCLGATDGLLIRNVGVNPTRTGVLTILSAMGARIELRNARTAGV